MFVIAGLLPNLHCADLAFQQNTNKLCRFREQTAHEPPQQWNRTVTSSVLLEPDMKFSLYKVRTWGEGRGKWKVNPLVKAPRAQKTVHFTQLHYKQFFFFPLKDVVGHCWFGVKYIILVPLIRSLAIWSIAAFHIPPIYLNTQIHWRSDSVEIHNPNSIYKILLLYINNDKAQNSHQSKSL